MIDQAEKKRWQPRETVLFSASWYGHVVHVVPYPWSRESVIQRRHSPKARIGKAIAFVYHASRHVKFIDEPLIPSDVRDAISRLARNL
tara:strand:- start:854 stop:1117 length:264 start_codon:yes stop_codon:yes gene_type:complete